VARGGEVALPQRVTRPGLNLMEGVHYRNNFGYTNSTVPFMDRGNDYKLYQMRCNYRKGRDTHDLYLRQIFKTLQTLLKTQFFIFYQNYSNSNANQPSKTFESSFFKVLLKTCLYVCITCSLKTQKLLNRF
jgi:hypothetical protein